MAMIKYIIKFNLCSILCYNHAFDKYTKHDLIMYIKFSVGFWNESNKSTALLRPVPIYLVHVKCHCSI